MKLYFKFCLTTWLVSALFLGNEARAEAVCTTSPDCSDLGYSQSASDCKNGGVKCPWDAMKFFCYEEDCRIGSILYSDKTCSTEVIPSKTAIGIVFDEMRGLALALDDSPTPLKWGAKFNTDEGTTTGDVPQLVNCSSCSCSTDGKANTSIILDFYKNLGISAPAAEYCNNYSTAGTSQGDWFLPSGAELRLIYKNFIPIQDSLSKLGKGNLQRDKYYWSSSEGFTNWAVKSHYKIHMENANVVGMSKGACSEQSKDYASPYVLPIINYREIGEITVNCTDGGYLPGVPTNNMCDKVTYNGRTCYENCYQPDCYDLGYQPDYNTGEICTTIEKYGRTCYTNCELAGCNDGGYLTKEQYDNSSWDYCSQTSHSGLVCYTDCEAGGNNFTCDSGYNDCLLNFPNMIASEICTNDNECQADCINYHCTDEYEIYDSCSGTNCYEYSLGGYI